MRHLQNKIPEQNNTVLCLSNNINPHWLVLQKVLCPLASNRVQAVRWDSWNSHVLCLCTFLLHVKDETSLEAGIRVQIHSQDEPPYIHQLGFGVSPGFQTFVSCQEQRVGPFFRFYLFIWQLCPMGIHLFRLIQSNSHVHVEPDIKVTLITAVTKPW